MTLKDKYNVMKWSTSKKMWYTFLAVFGIFCGCFYTGALIVPNWDGFIKMPWLHQLVAYLTLLGVGFLSLFILYIVNQLVYSHQKLEDKNKDLTIENDEYTKKVKALETELIRLKRDE